MHDIDRTRLESEQEFYPEESEFEFEQEVPFSEEFESPFQETPTCQGEAYESPLDEAEEMELAAELLGITSDAELDQFLGKVFRRVGRFVRRAVRSPVFRPVGKFLRRTARRILPIAGTAVGGYFGGPAGAALGGRLARAGGRIFGLELEGLTPEDQEFEVARRYVRFAGEVAKNAAFAPAEMDPEKAARAAVAAAARKVAPGLLRDASSITPGRPSALVGVRGRSGRWVRRGNRVVVIGV